MQAAIGSLGNISIASLKNSLDEVRAQVYPRNETEKKVYEALSSKNWGASTTLMNDIAGDTGDYEKFGIIMTLIWASIETDGKSWKQVFKALTLIEFLLKNGSERVIEACRDKIYKIRSLENFNFYEGTLDRGSGVREKSKQIVELLGSNEMIRIEREKANNLRDKFVGIGNDGSRGSTGSTSTGSHYSGNSGGGSYGNGGDRGFGNSYSGNQHSSNGGGHDSYSSNSNGRDSRYSNESYDSSRTSGATSGSGSNGRFRDEEYKNTTETVVPTRKSNDDDEDEFKIKHKPKSSSKLSAPVSDTAVGGKLKLSIKKGSPAAVLGVAAVQPAAMLDFMDSGDSDFMSAPAPTAPPTVTNSNVFDGFQVPTSSVQDDFGFASFDSAPVQQQSQAFDPFGMGSPPPLPQSQPVMQFSQPSYHQAPALVQQSFVNFDAPLQGYPVSQPPASQNSTHQSPVNSLQSYGQFTSPSQTSPTSPMMQPPPLQHFQQPAGYGSPAAFQPPPVQQQQQQQQQQPQIFRGMVPKAPEPVHVYTDNSTQSTAQSPAGKWGDIAGLVNLGGISKNESLLAKQQAAASTNYTPSSFSGLDGFSRSQSMSSTPMNMVRQAPMQQQYQQQPVMGAMNGAFMGTPPAQGQSQYQQQGYAMNMNSNGSMAPARGMNTPQSQSQQFGNPQPQYGPSGMMMQQQNMMGMGMGMGGQNNAGGMGMQGNMQSHDPRGLKPSDNPSYGYSSQGQNGNFQ